MHYHKNSLSQALLDLFPNIGLEKGKLWSQCMCTSAPLISHSHSFTLLHTPIISSFVDLCECLQGIICETESDSLRSMLEIMDLIR